MMKKITILLLIMVTLVSCSKQYFSVVVWNESNIKLRNVLVWDNGKLSYSMGVFSPQARYVMDFMYTPFSNDVKLTWIEAESGIKREVQVDMTGVVPKKYDNGVIHFSIENADIVSVNFYYNKKTNY